METLIQKRTELAREAKGIVDGAKQSGTALTDGQKGRIDAILAEVGQIDAAIKGRLETDKLMKQFDGWTGGEPGSGGFAPATTEDRGYLRVGSKDALAPVLTKATATGATGGVKSLVSSVDVIEPVMVPEAPVPMGVPASTIWDLIPARRVPRDYSFLQQTTRDNQAKPVAVGEVKPTSQYVMKRVENRLKVVAHLSEPIHIYDLSDNENLARFLANELQYGLFVGVENQLFNGDGTGENFKGLNVTSGIQVQTFKTDPILTTRAAITQLETMGYTPDGIFLNPLDWEAIETSQYLLNDQAGSPVDRAARRLWGVPVAISNSIARVRMTSPFGPTVML
ncbi:phage major capsid protein [Arsenicicoccus bolidensis]|uniref:phage major capsid protein n=1 Tax=Arsenicicoccus bolidensis TaxID=229480 RepID=UPI0004149B59|nr:phage major capsid protein [Arsenicicoccus bolidensis]